jgi:hypothetical protein
MVPELSDEAFIALVAKSFTHTPHDCKVCRVLPMRDLCEFTLDDLFQRRTQLEMAEHYEPRSTPQKPIYDHNIRVHRKHCDVSKLTEDDQRILGLREDFTSLLQKVYNMRFDKSMSRAELAEELYRQRLNNLWELQQQLELAKSERILLDSGALPKRMEQTYSQMLLSGSVIQPDYGLLSREVSANIRGLVNQIDAIQSDIQKTVANAAKAQQTSTTIVQVVNSSLSDVEVQLTHMLRDVKLSLDVLLPDNPQMVYSIMRTMVESLKHTVHPIIMRTKDSLLLEKL